MVNNDIPTFAIDSDILRSLAFIDLLMEENPKLTKEDLKLENKQDQLYKYFGYYKRFLKSIKEDKLRIVIVDAIFQESKHSESLVKFIKKYAYFPDINIVNYQTKADQARKLAYSYCQPYEYNNRTYPAPMKFVFIADISQRIPTNDAYAMAQASIEGLSFVTANGQDFIFNVKQSNKHHNKYTNSRSIGIINKNISHGYCSTNEDGIITAPKPMHIKTFGAMLGDDVTKIIKAKPTGKLIKAAEIIDDLNMFNESL